MNLWGRIHSARSTEVDPTEPEKEHYAHLLVHGALHAQGWDHDEDEDAQVMELRESEIMARLGFDNPY